MGRDQSSRLHNRLPSGVRESSTFLPTASITYADDTSNLRPQTIRNPEMNPYYWMLIPGPMSFRPLLLCQDQLYCGQGVCWIPGLLLRRASVS